MLLIFLLWGCSQAGQVATLKMKVNQLERENTEIMAEIELLKAEQAALRLDCGCSE